MIEADYTILKADGTMIDDLIEISGECFPFSLKWNSIKLLLRRYWKFLLESTSIEIYIIRQDKQIISFFMLIINIRSLQEELQKIQLLKYLILVFSVLKIILNPFKLFELLRYKIKRRHLVLNKSKILNSGSPVSINKIAWEELQGVRIKHRGKGFSKIMLKFIIERCKELQFVMLGANIKPDNTPSIQLHRSFGFKKYADGKDGQAYHLLLQQYY